MFKKLIILSLFTLVILPGNMFSQTKSPFSGDPLKYREELTLFMGPNLNDQQKATLNSFLVKWDSVSFGDDNKTRILDITTQLAARAMRPVPHFNDFLATLNIFIDSKTGNDIIGAWLTGLSETVFNLRFTTETIGRMMKNSGLMISDNILNESASLKWKVKGSQLRLMHDTVLKVIISDATLTCYSQRDSTEIYNASGTYFPDLQLFYGTKGRITWEKAGYGRDDVFAESDNYIINTQKNNFTIDSARLTHKTYFKTPVYGSLADQSITYTNKDLANYPQFETYIKEFRLDNIYEGVNYKGGLKFEGANVKGTGSDIIPAQISLYRNDTLYLKINSTEFIFSRTGLNAGETSMSLFLDKDSIYHTNLSFSYNAAQRQVNLFRGNNPVSKSPYFNSFHKLDMYFEYLSWDMKSSLIVMSRPRGAALGSAQFESASFFDAQYFQAMAGIDDYHPLVRFKRFAEYYYSNTFPVEAFAKWLGKPVAAVTGLCIDMAAKGFVFYDRRFNEITLKKKVDDFLNAYAKKKDYDIITISSETRAPLDNAILDLKNYRLTVNGVNGVFLSDSQRVAIFPYNNQVVIEKNRDLHFDGVVEAGLFTIFGHNFTFSYDTFKIRLQKIDSIKIAVETEELDNYGNPVIKPVENLIQLGTAELYIDNPNNKSGLRSMKQYPIINAVTYSYIFFDQIAGLEGVYPQSDFYFRVDPFTYENIDHYTNKDMNLAGDFVAGNILKPMRQFLTIQEDNSLGFNMNIPEAGVDVYGEKGRFFNNIQMSSKGLIGSGTLKHLTSVTESEEYRFFPDSMLTTASSFRIEKDVAGVYPSLNSQDVTIKWLTKKDEWLATNVKGKNFSMFDNGTVLDGTLKLTPGLVNGTGIVSTTDSRVTSDLFSFNSYSIKADTSDYTLKSATTDGFSFIAENSSTDINFETRRSNFHLNTDSSVVKFPEIQYICTMTDFTYNMDSRILDMEQKGKSDSPLMGRDELIRVNFASLAKPTFFSTNTASDTISFSSWKGSYHMKEEYIEAENINYIHIADALIQPDSGKIIIARQARIRPLENAIVAVNNRHLLHSAKINIESTKRYTGSGLYDYVDENKDVQQISFPELTVDTMATSARGTIPVSQKFMLSPDFSFSGDVNLYSTKDQIYFRGGAGIVTGCTTLKSYPVKFAAYIDPKNIMIPVSEKPRHINDNMVFSGSYINLDSIHIYPTFLSAQKSWTDVGLVTSSGLLYYDKAKSRYLITSLQKITDPALAGNMIAFDRNFCILSSEGKLNFGADYDLVNMSGSGKVIHTLDSGKVNIEAVLGFDFYFSAEALQMMNDEIRMMPTLKPVNLNSDLYTKGMQDILGTASAQRMKEDLDLFGASRNLPKEFNFELLLNEVNLYWNEASSSFRSKGKIGLGFIGTQAVNVYVDGFVEIQRRRTGDMFDIYLKADESTWYYFSYLRGNMMVQAGNAAFNTLISSTKLNSRKHPDSTVRQPYTYMISVEDRLGRFLQRMRSDVEPTEPR
jgi:hypothetical protein